MTASTRATGAAAPDPHAGSLLGSRGLQAAAVVIAFALVAFTHWQGDGLWFQGDAPRHAINGLFIWDAIRIQPRDPAAFALSYYARYPVIEPVTYPPLFYGVEGLAFALAGPSPHVAKVTVLLFAVVAGLYTMAFARRWIGSGAGWAGAFLAFTPAIVVWSNTVMLNVPATALGLAALYHFRRWLDEARSSDLVRSAAFLAATALTYYPGLSVVAVCVPWMLLPQRNGRLDRRLLWTAIALTAALIPLAIALVSMPIHTSRHVPTVASLLSATTWIFYWRTLPALVGSVMLVSGVAGIALGLTAESSRRTAMHLATWIVAIIVPLSLVPAKNSRYILLVAPAFVLAAALGIRSLFERVSGVARGWLVAAVAFAFVVGGWYAARVPVPDVSGYRNVAAFLRQEGPSDAVLYDGIYDGVLGFYIRAMDPDFERRLVRADKLLFQYGPSTTFEWVRSSNVASADDVMRVLRTEAGCRWIAIDVGPGEPSTPARRLLREVVQRPEFTLARSFPILGAGTRRVDLYRLSGDVQPVTAVELSFPSFRAQTFRGVVPIRR